ncbi:MAG: hypothetical protein KIT60_06910 [Burkholderiaceae bacterium]|nr:hypothetical protein [Burkholderiaceae bacterium]
MSAALRELQAVQRKLDGWELLHLRALAARQARQLDRLRALAHRQRARMGDLAHEASWADARADMFADALHQIDDVRLGLDREGGLRVLSPSPQQEVQPC